MKPDADGLHIKVNAPIHTSYANFRRFDSIRFYQQLKCNDPVRIEASLLMEISKLIKDYCHLNWWRMRCKKQFYYHKQSCPIKYSLRRSSANSWFTIFLNTVIVCIVNPNANLFSYKIVILLK